MVINKKICGYRIQGKMKLVLRLDAKLGFRSVGKRKTEINLFGRRYAHKYL